eukprot:gene12054-8610_t
MIATRSDTIVKLVRNGRTAWAKRQKRKLQSQSRLHSVSTTRGMSLEQAIASPVVSPNPFSLDNVLALHVAAAANAAASQALVTRNSALMLFSGNALDDGT